MVNDCALRGVTIKLPKEPQIMSIFRVYQHLVKHLLYVFHYSHLFHAKSCKHTNQAIEKIKAFKKLSVQRAIAILGGTIKHDFYLVRFVRVMQEDTIQTL